jgi:hypothetical protein
MPSKPTATGSTAVKLVEAHHRLALWTGLFLVVVLLAALGLSRSAQAAPAPAGSAFAGLPTVFVAPEAEDEEEFEEGEETAAECAEEAQEEIAEGEPVETGCEEEDEEGTEGELEIAPTECFVRTTAATIATDPAKDTVRLSLRYTSWTPATVSVSYRLLGGKGGLALGHATEHFGKKGVVNLTADLTDAEMVRAAAAHEFDVAVHAVNSPGYCGKIFAQQLSAHKAVGKVRLWTNPHAG